MNAIETIYKGRRFRSRLEARWAIFFDAIDIGWEYETEGFELGKTRYLTDFKLSSFGNNEVDLFVEIKPKRPSIEDIKKCYQVSIKTGTDMLLICGTPGLPEFSKLGPDWNLKTGYVSLHFPAKMTVKGNDEVTPFNLWVESCRFNLFQTGSDGYSLDSWPIYWAINDIDNETRSYSILNRVNSTISEKHEVYGVNPFGSLIRSHYFSYKLGNRLIDHDRLIYGYELATCARFEHDEFNLTIIDGFYRELELIPFRRVYSSVENSYALYYSLKNRRFISRKSNEKKPNDTITLIKSSPKLIIKQFVSNYPKSRRSNQESQIRKVWKGFLFRYRIRLKGLKLKRVTK
ncbi:MAG TPA: hypothetical protein VK050_03665 [Flavobacteriaceae bacterium]|nr:hypothetical protein [Flavobacteriaceae bacterium]